MNTKILAIIICIILISSMFTLSYVLRKEDGQAEDEENEKEKDDKEKKNNLTDNDKNIFSNLTFEIESINKSYYIYDPIEIDLSLINNGKKNLTINELNTSNVYFSI
ncbi:MAG: hypothetical protein JSV49_02090, partial [Thermoplasmata archaeon]